MPAPPARDDADANAAPPPFVASVGAADAAAAAAAAAAVGRERRLLLAGLRELEGRAAVPGVPLLA